ncbi:MAG: TIGR00282 family metallophosphoesterase [Synergistaceae bacterium]|jgi:metallophosphoesterase (TIGR00282 family)|nr:TIGR00282 family metallophosphoesterase [Synergistaceae bacterium]
MRLLFIGDVFGKPGRRALLEELPGLRAGEGPFDFVVINCENAAAGFGMTERLMGELFAVGVDVMTSGNHIWDKKEFVPLLAGEPRVLRPLNYPPGTPGRGFGVFEKNGLKLGVINIQGRAFMPPIDCPFRAADDTLPRLGVLGTLAVLVDFHAEATAEKIALARYLDGRVSALVGTHTHVQTADNAVLPGGTAFITDAGMTGCHSGVIGMSYDSVLPKFLTGVPCKFEVEESVPRVQGVVIDIDDETGRALDIRRIDLGAD